jgi:hypothetical protein
MGMQKNLNAYMATFEQWCKALGSSLDNITYEEKRWLLHAFDVRVTVYRTDHLPRYTLEWDASHLRQPFNKLLMPKMTDTDIRELIMIASLTSLALFAAAYGAAAGTPDRELLSLFFVTVMWVTFLALMVITQLTNGASFNVAINFDRDPIFVVSLLFGLLVSGAPALPTPLPDNAVKVIGIVATLLAILAQFVQPVLVLYNVPMPQ